MIMSSSVGGLVGSRSKITPALRKPPTERVRTGWRDAVWVLDGLEARRVPSVDGMAAVVVLLSVEARCGVVAGM